MTKEIKFWIVPFFFVVMLIVLGIVLQKDGNKAKDKLRESSQRHRKEKEVIIKRKNSKGLVYIKDSELETTPLKLKLTRGDQISIVLQNTPVVYIYKNQSTLEFQQENGQILVNGSPVGRIISEQDQRIPEKIGSQTLTNLTFKMAPKVDQWERISKLSSLLMLNLGETNVTDEGLKYLSNMSSLRMLLLARTPVTDKGLQYLKDLTSLRSLFLAQTQISDIGLRNLKKLNSLRMLDIGETDVTDEGLQYLIQMTSLRMLRLSKTQISDEGLKHLRKLKSLRSLSLDGTQVTDDGLKYLTELNSLHSLYLGYTDVTDEGVKKFRRIWNQNRIKRYLERDFDSLNEKEENQVLDRINQLGAQKKSVRKNARKKLLSMGKKVIYYLKRNRDHDNTEVKNSVQEIILKIAKDNLPELDIRY